MLRVSSYRKLFEEQSWSPNGRSSMQCAEQYKASVRGATADECDCDKLDFIAARELNKEGLDQFVKDRTVIAALNDRLVRLIELAHCLEEENEFLECQIEELEDEPSDRQASSSFTTTVAGLDYSLDAVVDRLRVERDEILCDTEKLQRELHRLKQEYEKFSQQRIFLQQERQDVAEEVDAVTAECLALREQAAIYEEQLANMEAQHKTAVESLLEPAEETTEAVAALKFGSPDITPALDVKEYYCQLAESLQFKRGASSSSAVVPSGDGKQVGVGGAVGSKTKDISEMKMLISELQKELSELEKYNEELEDEVEMKKAAYMEEIAELECTIEDMRHQEDDLEAQMKEQCEAYKELLREKMARDMEITAYRSLVEGEEERLCNL
ncbi:vimentin [Thunnus albacares]|uniref:vimentin n=1 Tax=Thunnus albacares TaxID=8236 RepID=UPI001CF6E2A0|nr:vimentin [Thunnus albacares]